MSKQLSMFGVPSPEPEPEKEEEVRYTDLPVYPINNFRRKEERVCIQMFLAVSDMIGDCGSQEESIETFQKTVLQVKSKEIPCPAQDTCETYACEMSKPRQIKLGETL